MVFRNKLKYWAPRIGFLVFVYTAISWSIQLFGTCGDAVMGFRECGPLDALGRLTNSFMFFIQLLLFIVIQVAGLLWFLSRGRKYVIYPREYETSFDDVRGQKEVVDSVQEVVKLFRGFREFKKLGGYPPHGLLFEGPPGTGKTLMAKAVAGQVGVPFIYAPASAFTNAIMGAGIMQIAMLFRKARKFSRIYDGCVIFIDEIDAIGTRSRNPAPAGASARPERGPTIARLMMMGMGGGGAGAINELLVQMDGMIMPRGIKRHLRRLVGLKPRIPQYNILVIGATNRSSDLDPALLRPGRFDRKIHVGLPDKEGRKDVIRYYLDKVRHETIDIDKFAQATIHYSPARIKNIINEGLIIALQDGRDALTWEDVWAAKMIDDIGLKQRANYTDREKAMTAVHEAGHAVVSHELLSADQQIQIITIVKRDTGALGMVYAVDLEERFTQTRDDVLNTIRLFLAGMVAEEMWFNTSTDGTTSDLYQATLLALNYIGRWGMGRRLFSYAVIHNQSVDRAAEMLSDPDVRAEVNDLLMQCKQEVRAILERRRDAVERIRDELIEREELVGDQLEELMREISGAAARSPGAPEALPPA